MIKAFLIALGAALSALFLALVVTAGIAETMSARQAGNALLAFAAVELAILALSTWGYRRLAASWAQTPAPIGSSLLFAGLVLSAALLMGLMALIVLNR